MLHTYNPTYTGGVSSRIAVRLALGKKHEIVFEK
jgi:hypothetical protein